MDALKTVSSGLFHWNRSEIGMKMKTVRFKKELSL